jgi:hypothetical protein
VRTVAGTCARWRGRGASGVQGHVGEERGAGEGEAPPALRAEVGELAHAPRHGPAALEHAGLGGGGGGQELWRQGESVHYGGREREYIKLVIHSTVKDTDDGAGPSANHDGEGSSAYNEECPKP